MSGRLVVMDSIGRDVKKFPLSSGLVTLGSAETSDIRVNLSTVCPHHAALTVHQAQSVIRNVGDGETLVNGQRVGVAALKHGDVISIGDRSMRWEYSAPSKRRQAASPGGRPLPSRGRGVRRGSGNVGTAPSTRDHAHQLAIEMTHRATMPASSGGKQVAIVQPQRRDTNEQTGASSASRSPQDIPVLPVPSNTTIATMWIESRKFSSRRPVFPTPSQPPRRTPASSPPPRPSTSASSPPPRRSTPTSSPPPRRSTTVPSQSPRRSTPASSQPPRRSTPTSSPPPRRSTTVPSQSPRRSTPASSQPPRRSTPTSSPPPRRSTTVPSQSPRRSTPASSQPPRRSTPTSSPPPRRSTTVPSQPPRLSTPAQPQPPRRALSSKKRTPLRLAVLRKAQSAHKQRVVKIEAPLKIDHTKQAAIMLMTGHTPKSRLSLNQSKKTPTYVIKKPSPVRKTPGRKSRQGGRGSRESGEGITPKRASTYSQDTRKSKRGSGNQSVTILEITDTTRASSIATRSSKSPQKSPSLQLLSPKKSALKDLSKKGNRKTESIKFDLSNLENHQEEEMRLDSEDSLSEDDITLHYSDTSNNSPSPRKSINSRSSRMLEKLGTTLTLSPSRTLTPSSPSARRSARGSLLVKHALNGSQPEDMDTTSDATVASAFRTRTLSPRTRNMESYSIVDLVSIDSDTSKSVYNSADSTNTTDYGTPNTTGRKTRSTINPTLLGSSTPYVAQTRATRSRSGPGPTSTSGTRSTRSTTNTRRSKSLSTPENKHVSVNSTRVSRASRSRSRINDSDLMLLDDTELEDSSPKTSRRTRTKSNIDNSKSDIVEDGTSTPEQRHSPVEVGTPVLSIQSLLDSSRSSLRSQASAKKGRSTIDHKRKTIGMLSEPRQRSPAKSKSLGAFARQTILRLSKDSSETSDLTDVGAPLPDGEDTVTPKSAVKLVPEAVKNKHSTAKKPMSKRSMIDDLNQSDIVKQLFNSPVKRKLSQSMTEFSRRQLFDDDEIVVAKRPTRNTIAFMERSIDDLSDHSGTFTPERFVSPIGTPSHSPDLSGIQRLLQRSTPENDQTDVRGVQSLLRTHRTRRSAKNDLSDVTGLKLMFANSPKNRLSDVRVKEVFKSSPNNDLRRVSGVKSLFRQTSPSNDLTDVRGVKKLFRKSLNNDLRNVSGVKRTLRNSLRNDLTDVRGVRRMFRNNRNKESSHDVSGVEELFNTSSHSAHNAESLFDQMVGKPPIKAVYSKTFSTKLIQKPKPKTRKAKSLHSSLDVITNNVEEWLEQELQKRFQRDEPRPSTSNNTSRNVTKELNNLATSTVDGGEPIRPSRTRNSSIKRSASEIYSAHTLPIKKRAVVHSTPVKGRVNLTMNASELGRVSPIAPVDKTQLDHDASLTRSTRQKIIPEESKSRVSRTPQKTPTRLGAKSSPKPQESPNPSPNKCEVASPKASPEKRPPQRVTRNRKNTTSDNNTKKRRTSLVISKKAPVMSPKADPKKSTETPQQSPKKRATRGRKEQKVETPKRTRVNAQKATIVVPKQSPKCKPQVEDKEKLEKTRRTRKNTAAEVETESPKESQPRATRGKQTAPKGKENKTDNVERPKRGRKAAAVEVEPPVTKRGRGKQPVTVPEVKTRGKSVTKAESKQQEENQPKTRGRKVEVQLSVESVPTTRRGRKNTEHVSLETQPKTRGKKVTTSESPPVESEPRTRGKKVEAQSSVQSEPVTRGRRTKAVDNTVIPETKGRKRKAAVVEEVPAKITKTTRGRKAETEEPEKVGKETAKTRGRPKKIQVVEETPAPTKPIRGKKAAEPKESPGTNKRKRTAKVEASTSPTKEAKKARNEPTPVPAAAAAAATRGRSTRAQPQEVSTAAPGRSRRRLR